MDSRIHKIEDLRRIHPIGRTERELTLKFPNYRYLYRRQMNNVEHIMNEREAKERYGMRRFREI